MRLRHAWLLLAGAAALHGEAGLGLGSEQYHSQHYGEACTTLAAVVAREPKNAEACHLLGLALRQRGGPGAFDSAAPWLQKATELAPANSEFLADYAGNCLEQAGVHRSYSLAARGRDLMEKAIGLDPNNLDGRYGLMRFNAEAPWPLGETSQAFTQAGEISRRDPVRGKQAFLWLGRYLANKHKSEPARRALHEVLRLDPHNAAAETALAGLK